MTAPGNAAALRLAVCQLRMRWDVDRHTDDIVQALQQAAAQGARLCLFPELALTGIHREIAAAAVPARVQAWLARVAHACRAHTMAASVGAPVFDAQGGIRIAQHFFDAQGVLVGTVEKQGLTAPEATFFVPGDTRRNLHLLGRRWNAMICREIDDAELLAPPFEADQPDIVVWPGLMRPDPDLPATDPPDHVQRAQALARRCRVHVVQANWPNALNRPEESVDAGRSAVIDRDGRLLFRLPRAEPGLAVFDLGASSFEWSPASV